MRKYFDSIIGSDGRPVAGASVTVTAFGGGAPSSIFSDSAGSVPKANPVVTDANGYFEFYAADGRYSLSIVATGFGSRTLTDIALEDPADPSQQTINGGSINNTPIGATTPNSGAFTTLSASGGITGTLTGNASTATTATNLSGGTVDATSVISSGNLRATSATLPLGYNIGSGGAVTQGSGSGKATAVTLDRPSGRITLDGAALNAATTVSFTLNNSTITADDSLLLTLSGSMGSMVNYNIWSYVTNGSAIIAIRNISGGSLSDTPTINFIVVKGSVS